MNIKALRKDKLTVAVVVLLVLLLGAMFVLNAVQPIGLVASAWTSEGETNGPSTVTEALDWWFWLLIAIIVVLVVAIVVLIVFLVKQYKTDFKKKVEKTCDACKNHPNEKK